VVRPVRCPSENWSRSRAHSRCVILTARSPYATDDLLRQGAAGGRKWRHLWGMALSCGTRDTLHPDQTLAPPVANRATAATAMMAAVSHPMILATLPFA
jgi:hypothetical protein